MNSHWRNEEKKEIKPATCSPPHSLFSTHQTEIQFSQFYVVSHETWQMWERNMRQAKSGRRVL